MLMGDMLKNKVAVVTGSGQGIGRAIAIGIALEGALVVTNNRKQGSTGNALLGDSLVNALDAEKREWFSKGVGEINGDAETTARTIKESGGEAVPFIKHAEYCTANAGVNGLTKAAAKELLPYGITCNAFAPWAKTRASYELETYDMAVSVEDSPWIDRKLAKKLYTTPSPD
jgi:NAD(P)-dependent dehydrogenase (short-subunit alcohol dehydrogenase family)